MSIGRDIFPIRRDYKIGCGYSMINKKLLLCPLVLDEFDDFRLRINLLPFLFECLKGAGVNILNFYSDNITGPSKLNDRLLVGQFSAGERGNG